MVYLKLFVVVLKMLLFVSLNQLSTEWKGKSTFDTVPTLGLGGEVWAGRGFESSPAVTH